MSGFFIFKKYPQKEENRKEVIFIEVIFVKNLKLQL